MTDLLPCPFCGGEAKIKHVTQLWEPRNSYWAQCDNCRMSGKHFTTEAEAISAWNTRGAGTCENKHKSITSFWCSECDAATSDGFADVGGKVERFNYCPNCGRKVDA